jgi:hypothetical protein
MVCEMRKIMNALLLSCMKATELIEKDSFFPLSALEKTQLFLHTKVCDACRTYQKQSKMIDDAIVKTLNDEEESEQISNPADDDALIEMIQKKINT